MFKTHLASAPRCLTFAFCILINATRLAHSADLAAYKPVPVASADPPAFDWTGIYVGGLAGGSQGVASQGYSVSSTWVSANVPSIIPYVDGVGSQQLRPRGAVLGLDAGYNWRVAKGFILGVAADLNWGDVNGDRTVSGVLPVVQLPYSITQRLSADLLGSLRLRAGATPLDNVLVYVTGGPAFGHFNYSASFWDNLVPPFAPGNETENATFKGIRAGWTLGTGAEWALSQHWTMTGEARHSEYSALSGTGILPLQQPPSTAYIGHSSGIIKINSFQIGVNYHFN